MTKLIGITGRSGSGKGAACEIFARHAVPFVDTDKVYHEILSVKGPCTDELAAAFGCGILTEEGLVDRKKLASAVFGHKNTQELLHTLNEITHKYIMTEAYRLVREHAEAGATAVLLDAPQLFEAHLEEVCDITLAIIADDAVCLSRIMARDGISMERASSRLAAQHDNAFFRANCTAVIENNGDLEALEQRICQFLNQYKVGV